MIIRVAENDDIDDIKRLLDELNRLSTAALPEFFKAAPAESSAITQIINSEKSEIILAEVQGYIGGLIEIHLNETKDIPVLVKKQYIYIQHFIVDAAFRQKGIGRALLAAAGNWGLQHGVKCMRLSVIPGNTEAIAFYRKAGFRHIMHSMEMPCDEIAVKDGSAGKQTV